MPDPLELWEPAPLELWEPDWEDWEPLDPDCCPDEGLWGPELPPLGLGGVGIPPEDPDGCMGGVLQAAR